MPQNQMIKRHSWYSKRDLNPHSRNGQGILSPSCLPIPPFEQLNSDELVFSHERAENETRTRDPNLGKVVLYQLSYFRLSVGITAAKISSFPVIAKRLLRYFFLSPQQGTLGSLHDVEVEAIHHLLHQRLDTVVA